MPGCCSTRAYGEFFDEKQARRDADGYRRKGLRGAAKRLVELVAARGVERATLLEIGGGVGALQIELIERGVARAANVELSASYEDAARELLRERGLEERVERRVLDLAQEPDAVEPADVVVLHRVVCCYGDYDRLLSTAAVKARRMLAFTYPPDNAITRRAVRILNLWPRLRGCEFRAYVHPERAMLGVVEEAGFTRVARERAGVWRMALLERAYDQGSDSQLAGRPSSRGGNGA